MEDSDQNKPIDDSEKIEIFLSDDEKIKTVGELLTNNSSRTILQLLFDEELTANQIARHTNISLQLVKYHLNKMQQAGMIKISKIGQNVKAQDMKYYKATKFAIVILPSKVSNRAKESRSLIRSIKTIYKFAGVGVAAVAGLFSLSLLQQELTRITPVENQDVSESIVADSEFDTASPYAGVSNYDETILEESLQLARVRTEEIEPVSSAPYVDGTELTLIFILIGAIVVGASAFLLWKMRRNSKHSTKNNSQV